MFVFRVAFLVLVSTNKIFQVALATSVYQCPPARKASNHLCFMSPQIDRAALAPSLFQHFRNVVIPFLLEKK